METEKPTDPLLQEFLGVTYFEWLFVADVVMILIIILFIVLKIYKII